VVLFEEAVSGLCLLASLAAAADVGAAAGQPPAAAAAAATAAAALSVLQGRVFTGLLHSLRLPATTAPAQRAAGILTQLARSCPPVAWRTLTWLAPVALDSLASLAAGGQLGAFMAADGELGAPRAAGEGLTQQASQVRERAALSINC
jgi:hypothetical protein